MKLKNNYGAHLISEEMPLGTEALIGCCEYYCDKLVEGSRRGEKWVYSNKNEFVPQLGYFDDMIVTDKLGTNCASPMNWAFIDMGIMPPDARFWGGAECEIARYDRVRDYIDPAVEIFHYPEGIPFCELYEAGKIKTGDILLAKLHTFIYRGGDMFFAAGHDGKWHPDESVAYKTEDKRAAVFDSWLNDFENCGNYRCRVYHLLRFREDYVPPFFRNKDGKLEKTK